MDSHSFRFKRILLTRGVVDHFSLTHCMVILIFSFSAIRVEYHGVGIHSLDVALVAGTDEMAGVSTLFLIDVDD